MLLGAFDGTSVGVFDGDCDSMLLDEHPPIAGHVSALLEVGH
jgi:hypothetical protein